MDGKANKEGGAFERKSLRRPQFAPGQDALLDSAPPSDSLAQAFSTNPAAIRARKAREESRAQHGPPVKGPQAPAITCLLYTSPSPRDATLSRMPSSA